VEMLKKGKKSIVEQAAPNMNEMSELISEM
jgi:hypothetical protein